MQPVHRFLVIAILLAGLVFIPVSAINLQSPFDGEVIALLEPIPVTHTYYIFELNDVPQSVYTNEGTFLVMDNDMWDRLIPGNTYYCDEMYSGVILTNCRESSDTDKQTWVLNPLVTDYKEWNRVVS